MRSARRWITIGATGSAITAVCCFTPLLVWLFAALGLSAVVGYLDYVLLPLLAVFLVILLVGIVGHWRGRSA